MKRKGLFVVFEGIDGSGKSSVCSAISEKLSKDGIKNILTAEPTTDEIGSLIRKGIPNISNEAEALLFAADRAQHTIKIKEWLDDGNVVICDRYYMSTLAYQSAPFNGHSLDTNWLIAINEPISIDPDITFMIDISPEVGLERVGTRGKKSKFERHDYLDAVRNNYLRISKEREFVVVDGERPKDDIVNEIYITIINEMERKDASV